MRNISALRKVFAEHGGPNYIDTIPRRGYRFNADVRVESEEKSRRRSVALRPWRLLAGEVRSVAIGSAVIEATITKLSASKLAHYRQVDGVAEVMLRGEGPDRLQQLRR